MKPSILRRKLYTAWIRYNPRALQAIGGVNLQRSRAYLWNLWGARAYHWVDWEHFLVRKHSSTIFVFGGGASLRDVSAAEWAKIDRHNTLGWRNFAYQTFVHADYLILRELVAGQGIPHRGNFARQVQPLMDQMEHNPHFKDSLVLVQGGWHALAGNYLMGMQLAPLGYDYLRFYNGQRGATALPATDFKQGITHVFGTLTDAVNLAYLGGWKQIVLIGIDLYDSQYFVQADEKIHEQETGAPADVTLHATARSGIVEKMGEWEKWLRERGVQLSVYNPRSLLAEVMPIFSWEHLPDAP